MSVILMTTLFYEASISQGELWCQSLLVLKGLKPIKNGPEITVDEICMSKTCAHSYSSIQSIQCTQGNNFNPAHFDIILWSVTKQMYGENKVESISV